MNKKKSIRNLGKLATIAATTLTIGAGSAFAKPSYEVGCAKGKDVEISYMSRNGPVSGEYECVTGKVGDNDYGDIFTKQSVGGADIIAYTEKDGWHYVKGRGDKRTGGGLVPFTDYSENSLKIRSLPQEKPQPAEKPLKDKPTYAYIDRPSKATEEPEKPKASKPSVYGIAVDYLTSEEGNIRQVSGKVENWEAGLRFGSRNDKVNQVTSESFTFGGNDFEAKETLKNIESLGVVGGYNFPAGNNLEMILKGGYSINNFDIVTDERILNNGNVLTENTNSRSENADSISVQIGIGYQTENAGIRFLFDAEKFDDERISENYAVSSGLGISWRF